MVRRYTRSRRRGSSLRPINSMKNVVENTGGVTTTQASLVIAKAKDNPATTVNNDVQRGCIIKAIYLSFDVCGLAGTGVLQRTNLYLFKNPGANLTLPSAFSVGTSNEKKYSFRQWSFMTMRNQDGNPPNHFEGWIPIPKRYQRMGTDDLLELVFENDSSTGHISMECIYKWYT